VVLYSDKKKTAMETSRNPKLNLSDLELLNLCLPPSSFVIVPFLQAATWSSPLISLLTMLAAKIAMITAAMILNAPMPIPIQVASSRER